MDINSFKDLDGGLALANENVAASQVHGNLITPGLSGSNERKKAGETANGTYATQLQPITCMKSD